MTRFKIVTTKGLEQPHHVVLVAKNGQVLMTSENYADIRDAEKCVNLAIGDNSEFTSAMVEYVTVEKS